MLLFERHFSGKNLDVCHTLHAFHKPLEASLCTLTGFIELCLCQHYDMVWCFVSHAVSLTVNIMSWYDVLLAMLCHCQHYVMVWCYVSHAVSLTVNIMSWYDVLLAMLCHCQHYVMVWCYVSHAVSPTVNIMSWYDVMSAMLCHLLSTLCHGMMLCQPCCVTYCQHYVMVWCYVSHALSPTVNIVTLYDILPAVLCHSQHWVVVWL